MVICLLYMSIHFEHTIEGKALKHKQSLDIAIDYTDDLIKQMVD